MKIIRDHTVTIQLEPGEQFKMPVNNKVTVVDEVIAWVRDLEYPSKVQVSGHWMTATGTVSQQRTRQHVRIDSLPPDVRRALAGRFEWVLNI